ncbi:MAG: hypothetical protein BWY15_01686 [Firmicutes bacterium ADurb.Bin193]|nr:MAG: hypothetical protein BWY15_01686 [Firmicutes bacterium ADurb.Bin193]
MNRLGIIARSDERIVQPTLFDRLFVRTLETLYLEDYDIEAVSFFVGNKIKNLEKTLTENGISVAVCTQSFLSKFKLFDTDSITLAKGKIFYRRLTPKIIKKIAKIAGVDPKSGSIAISEENPSLALSLVENLCDNFKYITVISKNAKRASEISEKILDEYGIPIIIAGSDSKVNCDIAVKTGTTIPVMSKNTILIDASCEHTITRKNSVDWIDVSLSHNLPYKIDSLSLAEAFELVTGSKADYKITAFRCGTDIVPTSIFGIRR